MKKLNIFVLFQFCILSIISGQKDSIEFIYRDWYLNCSSNKEYNIGDSIIWDTIQLDPKFNNHFRKWEFKRNGDFLNLYVHIIQEGEFKGEVMGISDDDVKWELDNASSELRIKYEDFIARYKILRLNKLNLILRKLNTMKPQISK